MPIGECEERLAKRPKSPSAISAFAISFLSMSTVAFAIDRPIIGPAPAWVRPVAAPASEARTDGAAVRLLLSDQQVALERGRQTVYSESALRLQTPQGLAAGNIAFAWRPDTDIPTVHKLLIRRGDKVIDVLASGQTFTVVRREQNLENATLDGVLTANIQPEGLQVGDIIEFAASVTSSDPVLKGHVEQIAGAWNGLSIGHAHLRVQWPATLSPTFRASSSLPTLTPVKAKGVTSVELSLDAVEPIVTPKGAPPRFSLGRMVEITDFTSWADLSALLAPLYRDAAVLPAQGSLRNELERIRALSVDPKARVEAALALVEDRIRYVALVMGAGGLTPAAAETTWARRYGDCKAKTALLLALLKDLGVEAEPVLVSTTFGDGLNERLPMVGLFNHVLVRATLAGKTYWLDGTRTGDTSLDRLTTPAFGWGLPLRPAGATLVRMLPDPLSEPTREVKIQIDATEGITAPAPVKAEMILRGDGAFRLNSSLASLSDAARERALRDYWKDDYDFIEVKSVGATFDAKAGVEHLTMDGEARLEWPGDSYEPKEMGVGYRADFSRDAGPNQDAPFEVSYPYYTRNQETILLPKGSGDFRLGPGIDLDQTVAGFRYQRKATLTGNVFAIENTARSIASEFEAKDAPAAQATLRQLSNSAAKLFQPSNYRATDKELLFARADTPSSALDYYGRARIFMGRGLNKEALLDCDKAIALDQTNASIRAYCAFIRMQSGDLNGAKTELEKSVAETPVSVQIIKARGLLAQKEERFQDAILEYSRALIIEPGNSFSLLHRAESYSSMKKFDDSLADLNSYLALNPENMESYIVRGQILVNLQRYAEAIKDFDHANAFSPNNGRALAGKAMAEAHEGRMDDAVRDVEAAVALDPGSAYVLQTQGFIAHERGRWREAVVALTRALEVEPKGTFALDYRARAYRALRENEAALTDSAAVLKANPANIDVYLMRANFFKDQSRPDLALAEAAAATTANPNDGYAWVVAASIYSGFHKNAEAMRAYDRALAIKPQAYIYLNRSMRRPKTDFAGRRADLDAALSMKPDLQPAIAELGRLQTDEGDFAGAIKTYTKAMETLTADPDLLVHRGIAYAKNGDSAQAELDFSAARATARTASALTNLCRSKAMAGVSLNSALADCDDALNRSPDAPYILEARGLVFLRLGRVDEAIADYDRALAKRPDQSSSLYGRAVAWARKGEAAKSDTDLSAALKIDPNIRTEFEGYGVKL